MSLNITGYSDRIYARPGDTVNFMVSCETPVDYRAELVRIICGDENPDGPGVKEEVVASAITGRYAGRRQVIRAGSYVRVPDAPVLLGLESFTVAAYIWPTTPERGRQGLVSRWSGQSGFALVIDDAGGVALELGDGVGRVAVASGAKLLARRWYRVGGSYDSASGKIRVFQLPLHPVPGIDDAGEVTAAAGIVFAPAAAALYVAAIEQPAGIGNFYNGKLDAPVLVGRALPGAADVAPGDPGVIGIWDFSRAIATQTAICSVPALHGQVVNFPARGMTGWNWTGETMTMSEAPEQWGAIHFHDDDIYDAAWEIDFALVIAAELRSGIYAARLTSGADEEYIPFAVGPAPGAEQKIALLLPTASYMAYGNDRLGMDGGGAELLNNILNVITPHEIFLNDHPEYGASLYDAHSDGSGICYSSRLRPLVNMRPKRQGNLGGFGGSKLWQFAADTHITDWLEAMGHGYDVVTDEELHDRGAALLRPYAVVLTGTHPEYYATAMLDAVRAYRDAGGRLMYLGGNGFYWRIAFHPECPGIIELRRTETGVRAWSAAPGEYHQSFDGRLGGVWMRLGRTPQMLAGVGFSCQGFDLSTYYVRQPDSYRPEAGFIMEGIGDERIGDFGLIAGGAAGLELDRAAAELGTPPNALVLATSENLTNTYLVVPEEYLETAPGLGAHENALARGDIVFFTVVGGGAVFSTGSIAWAGSLSHDGYANNVSRMTDNVLRRFIDELPFDV